MICFLNQNLIQKKNIDKKGKFLKARKKNLIFLIKKCYWILIVTLLSFSEYKFNTNRLFQFLMPWHQLKFIFNLSLSMKASIFSMCLPHETRVDNPLHISCLIGNREEVESTLRQLHHWLCSRWNLLNIWQYNISLNLDFSDRILPKKMHFSLTCQIFTILSMTITF